MGFQSVNSIGTLKEQAFHFWGSGKPEALRSVPERPRKIGTSPANWQPHPWTEPHPSTETHSSTEPRLHTENILLIASHVHVQNHTHAQKTFRTWTVGCILWSKLLAFEKCTTLCSKPQQTNIFLTNSCGGYEEIVLWLIYTFFLDGLKGSTQLTDRTLKQILWMSLRGYSNWECNSLKYSAGNSCHSVSWTFVCYFTMCSIIVRVFLQKARKCTGKSPAVNCVASLKTQGSKQNGS